MANKTDFLIHNTGVSRLLLRKLIFCFFVIFVLFLSQNLFSQEKASLRLEWVGDENALEYKVEVKNASGDGKSMFYSTKKNYVDVLLGTGAYRYRVFVYDMLGRESSVSSWTLFDVEKFPSPEIASVQKEAEIPDIGTKNSSKEDSQSVSTVSIETDVANVTEKSKAELINEKTGEVVQGKLIVRGIQAQFDDLTPGEWKLRITNPDGSSTESDDSVNVRTSGDKKLAAVSDENLPEAKDEKESSENKSKFSLFKRKKNQSDKSSAPSADGKSDSSELSSAEDAEKSAADSAAAPAVSENTDTAKADDASTAADNVESPSEIEKSSGKERLVVPLHLMTDEEFAALSDKERIAARKFEYLAAKQELARERKNYRKAHPYIPHEFFIFQGAGFSFAPYTPDLRRKSFGEIPYPTYFNAKLAAFSEIKNKTRHGFEIGASVTVFDMFNKEANFQYSVYSIPTNENSYRKQAVVLSFLGLNFVWQRQVFNEKLFFSLKGGGGLTSFYKKNLSIFDQGVKNSDFEDAYKDNSFSRLFPTVRAGTSVYFIPFKHLALEAGCDFMHIFVPDMKTGIISPYLCVGIRL